MSPATRLRTGGGRLGAVPQRDADLRYRTVHGYRRAFRVAGSGPPVTSSALRRADASPPSPRSPRTLA